MERRAIKEGFSVWHLVAFISVLLVVVSFPCWAFILVGMGKLVFALLGLIAVGVISVISGFKWTKSMDAGFICVGGIAVFMGLLILLLTWLNV